MIPPLNPTIDKRHLKIINKRKSSKKTRTAFP